MKDVCWLVLFAVLGMVVGAGLGAQYVDGRTPQRPERTPPETWCLDGVGYLVFPAGATVAYDRDGHVVRCEAP